jgi:hypothetical protein
MMEQSLYNMSWPMIIVGAIIGIISFIVFFVRYEYNEYQDMKWAVVGFAFGLLLFMFGCAIPAPPKEPERPQTREQAARELFDQCMQSIGVGATPANRLACLDVVERQLDLYQIAAVDKNERKGQSPQVSSPNSNGNKPVVEPVPAKQ